MSAKQHFSFAGALLLAPACLLILLMTGTSSCNNNAQKQSDSTAGTGLKRDDGQTFRDLNKNGKLDIYEDSRQPIEARVNDLLGQMTLEEKTGLMFINGARINDDG